MNLDIKLHQKGKFGRFYVGEDYDRQAELMFEQPTEDKLVLLHTEVKESMQGKGMGRKFLNHAADYARQNGLTIVPLCPYAKRVMEKEEAYQDVIVKVR